jgi:PAS domain S-box-containing protein
MTSAQHQSNRAKPDPAGTWHNLKTGITGRTAPVFTLAESSPPLDHLQGIPEYRSRIRQPDSLLVVTKNQTTLKTLNTAFIDPGLSVHHAPNTPRAWEILLSGNNVDLICIDAKITGSRTPEMVRNIKDFDPDIEVIVLADSSQHKLALKAMKAGASDCVLKPIAPKELKHTLKTCFDNRLHRLQELAYRQTLEEVLEQRTAQLHQWESQSRHRDTLSTATVVTSLSSADKTIFEQTEFLNNVIESLDYPFYVIDVTNHTVTLANRTALQDRDLDNLKCFQLTHHQQHPCHHSQYPCPLKQVKDTGKPAVVKHTHYHRDGTSRTVEVHAYPVSDPNGNVAQVIAYDHDITRQRTTQKKLIRSANLAEVGKLAASIAHQINNPLYGIMNTLEIVAGKIQPDDHAQELVKLSLHQIDRVKNLLWRLMDLYQPLPQQEQVFELNALLKDLLAFMKPNMSRADVALLKDFATAPLTMAGSPDQIQQVCMNLITNALHAMPNGGKLTVRTRKKGRWIHLDITDTGHGIAPDNIDRIFDAFFTTKHAEHSPGLGLSISLHIIQNHHGKIDLKSKVDHGTTFTVTLPFRKGDPTP